MSLKIVLSVSWLFLLINFSTKYNLESDHIYLETFNDEEHRDLTLLIDFSDDLVQKKTQKNNINEAYHLYFDRLQAAMLQGYFIVPIDDKEKFHLLENVNGSTIDEIWHVDSLGGKRTDHRSKVKLTLNINGKFIDYIEKTGNTDSIFYGIHDIFVAMGDIHRSGFINFLAEGNNIDFNKIRYRLLAVVCLLSINEPLERSE